MDRNEDGRDHAPDRARRELLHDLLSPWRRRGRRLLQIGGSPLVPPSLFWEAGFDAVCIESGPDILNAAREESGQVVEYTLGQPDSLPFEDDSFDYAVLPDSSSVVPSSVPRGAALRAVVAEAVRVASHGVIMVSANPPGSGKLETGMRRARGLALGSVAGSPPRRAGLPRDPARRVPGSSHVGKTKDTRAGDLPSFRPQRPLSDRSSASGGGVRPADRLDTPRGDAGGRVARTRSCRPSQRGGHEFFRLAADGAACPEAEGTDGRLNPEGVQSLPGRGWNLPGISLQFASTCGLK